MSLLLIETVNDYRDRFEIVDESVDGKPKRFLEGIYLQAEVWNGNGRWYQNSEITAEAERFNTDIIPNRKAIGELDHSAENQPLLHRASHIFETPLRMEGNDCIGKAKVMDTGYGQTLSVLIDEKIPFGVSSKGMGKLSKIRKEGKTGSLVSGFQMRSPGDVVYNQSAPNAIPNVVMEMILENDSRMEEIWGREILDPIRERLQKIAEYEIDEVSAELFKSLINK